MNSFQELLMNYTISYVQLIFLFWQTWNFQIFLMQLLQQFPHQNYFIFIGGGNEEEKLKKNRINSFSIIYRGASFFKGNYMVDYGGTCRSSLMIIIQS